MHRTSGTATNSVNVLVTFRGVFGKINTSTKHPTDVSMSFIESFLYDSVDERRAVEKHPFIALVVVLFRNLMSAMTVTLPKFTILYLLYLKKILFTKKKTKC